MMRLGSYLGPDLTSDPEVIELRRNLFEYLRRPPNERAQRRIPINESIFYRMDVQDAVAARCNGKCIFCESPRAGEESVDHFRPVRDTTDLIGQIDRDYYAWLAYEPDNLIFICAECGRSKGRKFPVEGQRAPYIATLPEVRRLERALLVDAYRDNPDRHFDFLADGWCEPLTDEAKITVSVVGLNRPRLIDMRLEAMPLLFKDISDLLHGKSEATFPELFDPRRPFAGAKLNILKRLLQGFTIRGTRISGPVTALPVKLQRALGDFGSGDRERLERRIEELRSDDRDRSRWDDRTAPVVMMADVPRQSDFAEASRVRSGGLADLTLRNFKGIEELSLPIRSRQRSKSAPCLMILGENAVGKSSILQAIALALIGGPQARRLKLQPFDYLRNRMGERWDQLAPDDVEVDLQFRFRDQLAHFRLDAVKRRILGNDPPASIVLGYGPRRYFDRRRSRRGQGAYSRVQTLFSPTAALPYPGTWLNELTPQVFDEVAQVMRVVLSLREEDQLVRDLDGRICVKLGGQAIPIEWLSEGYRSVFVMVADIVRELLPYFPVLEDAEAIVLIDEIETHLHPRWKMRVMTSLRRALPNVQFIVTTHDPLCLRGMDDGEVVVLQRDANGNIVSLADLPSIKGMRADQLLTSDYFGLSSTIDPQTEIDFARYVGQVQDLPPGRGGEADQLVRHLTVGDDAQEQVMHEAMRRFIDERERPTGALRPEVREEAVLAVLAALRDDIG